MHASDVVIVGTGHGGAQAAVALRQNGFAGSIAMLGRESELPYERPPLSKEYLAREKAFERILIRPASFWADKSIDVRLNSEVVAIDPDQRELTLSDGSTARYRDLIWAAGGNPRRLTCEGGELKGVHSVRTRADVDAIMEELGAGSQRVVVIGGGYIGLEAAAVLTKLDRQVVLLEALDRVLARVAGKELSRFFEAEHRAHGVDLRVGVQVDCLEGREGRVRGVRLQNGETLPCDMVIVGIGIEPSIEPLVQAGVRASNGVEVDAYCRSSLPNVYAIGDCAAHTNRFADNATIRLESVQNAADMATVAAKAICGQAEPYVATPWFWSNQFDLKLQTVGLSDGHDRTVLRGDPRDRSFSIIYLKAERVIALDCINATKDYVQGRKLVELRSHIPLGDLANSNMPLKDLLLAASV